MTGDLRNEKQESNRSRFSIISSESKQNVVKTRSGRFNDKVLRLALHQSTKQLGKISTSQRPKNWKKRTKSGKKYRRTLRGKGMRGARRTIETTEGSGRAGQRIRNTDGWETERQVNASAENHPMEETTIGWLFPKVIPLPYCLFCFLQYI